MAYGKVSEAYWHDDKIRSLSEDGRHLMLYLMSCPHGNRLGLFVLAPAYAAEDVQWEIERVTRTLAELRDASRVQWDERNRVVFVRHYLRHNTLLNQSVVKGAINDLASLPESHLLGDLLAAVVEEQKGPSGRIRGHYKELEEAIRSRILIRGAKTRTTRADAGGSHNAGHNAPHNDGHYVDQAPTELDAPGSSPPGDASEEVRSAPEDSHNAGHNATQAWGGKGRQGSKLAHSSPPPSLAEPDLTSPSRTWPGPAGPREVGESIEAEVGRHRATARANIVAIHGSEQPVEIHGHLVGVGIELERYKRVCAAGFDPPEIVAQAIAHVPQVTGLERPVSLALWESDGGGLTDVYQRCVTAVHTSAPPIEVGAKAKGIPVPRDLSDAQREAHRKLEEARRQEASS